METVNLTRLSELLADYVQQVYGINLSVRRSRFILFALVSIIKQLIKQDIKVAIRGLGTFETAIYKGRQVETSITPDAVFVEEHKIPKFRPSNLFKKYIRFGTDYDVKEVAEKSETEE